MSQKLLDGSRLQAGIRRYGAETIGQGGPRPYYFPEAGVVLRVYAKDHEQNRYKSFVECDVFLSRIGVILPNVPVSHPVYGETRGMEWKPKAPTQALQLDPPDFAAIDASDGDRVIVDFLGGFHPIIRGQNPRVRASGMPYAMTEAEGDRFILRHGGTTIRILGDGEVQIDVPAGKSVRLQQGSASVIQIVAGEDIKLLTPTGGKVVHLGTETGEGFVLIDNASWQTWIVGHMHTDPISGTTGPPTTTPSNTTTKTKAG